MRSAANSRLHERRGEKYGRGRMRFEPRRDLALWCQSRMAEAGLVPPHSVLAPGTALALLRSSALPSAQAKRMVGHRTQRCPPAATKQRGDRGPRLVPVVRSELSMAT